MKKNSRIMDFFISLKLNSIAWSFRRLYVPVDKNALVLEVGSGGNPFFRSNVLMDAYLETSERHFEKLVSDRPTILGYVENMPFKDNAFDFVIACHVLEHSADPEKFISEIQRVAKAGYIEVPDALFERLTCYPDHRLEITDINNKLIIRKKKGPMEDPEVNKLFLNKFRKIFHKATSIDPFLFHVRLYWDKSVNPINYEIINSKYQFDWDVKNSEFKEYKLTGMANLKRIILNLFNRTLSQTSRNKKIDIHNLLMCPNCKDSNLIKNVDGIECIACGVKYPLIDNDIIKFI